MTPVFELKVTKMIPNMVGGYFLTWLREMCMVAGYLCGCGILLCSCIHICRKLAMVTAGYITIFNLLMKLLTH